MLIKLLVDSFDGCLFKHVWTNIDSIGISKSMLGQILSDKTSSTCQIKNFYVFWILLFLLGEFQYLVGNILWIRIPHPKVHSFVVGGKEIEMSLGMFFLVFATCLVHLFMLIGQSWNGPIKSSDLDIIHISAH